MKVRGYLNLNFFLMVDIRQWFAELFSQFS